MLAYHILHVSVMGCGLGVPGHDTNTYARVPGRRVTSTGQGPRVPGLITQASLRETSVPDFNLLAPVVPGSVTSKDNIRTFACDPGSRSQAAKAYSNEFGARRCIRAYG